MKNDLPTVLAAPAPLEPPEIHTVDLPETEIEKEAYLIGLSEAWAGWVRTRRLFCPPSLPPSILGRLRSPVGRLAASGGPDAFCSAQLAAFNEAVEREPMEALDRQVFEMQYRYRVKPVKTYAEALGISRAHWYRLLRAFEHRAYAAACEIQERNEAERRGLRSCIGPV